MAVPHGRQLHRAQVARVYFCLNFRSASLSWSRGILVRPLKSPPEASHPPPSIVTHSPVMYGAASLTRKAARLANSSWLPKRRIGIRDNDSFSSSGVGSSRDHAPSVGNGPGAIAFTRMPYAAHSTASDRVIASTPAFEAAEGTTNADPVHAYVVMMLRNTPV